MADRILIASGPTAVHRFSRYSGVSVVSTVLGLGLLYLFNTVGGIYAPLANVLAVLTGVPPIYLLIRRWVWAEAKPVSELAAFGQFLVSLAVSTVVSTTVIAVVDRLWGDGLLAVVAAVASYGVVWLLRFAFLDRMVFAR